MRQKGRKSAAALAVVAQLSDHRPPPPADLSEEQEEEWMAVTRRLPADFFPRECHGLLASYCRHVTTVRMLSKLVDEFRAEWTGDDGGLRRLDKLLAMREREARALSATATRLRITPQSRYHQRTAAVLAEKSGSDRSKPWDPKRGSKWSDSA